MIEDANSKVINRPTSSEDKSKEKNPYGADTESEDESITAKVEKKKSTTPQISTAATMAYNSDDEIKASMQSDKSLFDSITSIDRTLPKSESTDNKPVHAETVTTNDDSDATDVDDNINFSSPLFSTAPAPHSNKTDSQIPDKSSVASPNNMNKVVDKSESQTTKVEIKQNKKVLTTTNNQSIDSTGNNDEKRDGCGLKRKKSGNEKDEIKSDTDDNLNYATVDEESPDIALEHSTTDNSKDDVNVDVIEAEELITKKKNKRQKVTPVANSSRSRSRRQQQSMSSTKDSSSTTYASSVDTEDKAEGLKVMFTGVIDEDGEKVSYSNKRFILILFWC